MGSGTAGLTTAVLWRGGRDLDLVTLPLPAPDPGEVIVRVSLATVCGSDLHTVAGHRTSPSPSILGHEAVGEVVDIGSEDVLGLDGVALGVGDRVVWGVVVSCGTCDRCSAGRSAKCRAVRKTGHESSESDWPLSGGYAEHVLLPRGSSIARVPASLPDTVAAPAACATATVMAVLERAGDLSGLRVGVWGAGMLGLTAAAAARDAGAATVLVVDPDVARRDLALTFGATAVAAPGETQPVDVALEFSGASSAVAAALGSLDIGGRLVLAGSVSPAAPVSVDPEDVVRRWLSVSGVHNYEPRHLASALDFLAGSAHRWPWESLVSAPVPLAEAPGLLLAPAGARPRSAVAP